MTQEEEIAHLRAENQALREALNQALAQLSQVREDLRQALVRIEELEKQKTPPPEFVKANVKKPKAEEKKQRKKRATEHNHGRPRSAPTQIVEHRIVTCPDCQLRLGGISLARVREVIDVPPPPPVEVTHHRIFKGWCAQCQKWHEAPVDFHTEVLGQGRLGVRLSSLIATLRTVMRLPIRQIRQLLLSLHGVEVSIGEIVEILHRISTHAQPLLDDLKATIRASSAVQADETGWREDGLNGYIWSVSTPTMRYYEYHHSRAGEVIKQLLGETFQGVLGSDFYAGYNIYQGCASTDARVHYLRDIHKLKDKYPDEKEVWRWAKAVKDVYDQAVAWVAQEPDPGWSPRQLHQRRVAQQQIFEQQLWAICQPYVGTTAPQQVLCKRVEDFLPELFVFVAVPGVPAHNNLAERSVRPLVIARKISGGSRSRHRITDAYGVSESLWHLDGARTQSFLPMPGSPDWKCDHSMTYFWVFRALGEG